MIFPLQQNSWFHVLFSSSLWFTGLMVCITTSVCEGLLATTAKQKVLTWTDICLKFWGSISFNFISLKLIIFCSDTYIPSRRCLKNRNMGHCPKRWEGVPTGSQIFQNVQMGHGGVGGRGSQWPCPKCST